MIEKDLFKPIHDYFENLGYEVHGEVSHCDITAVKGDELKIIELKLHLNLELLIQAAKRQRISDSVYIAFPRPNYSLFSKKWKDICYLIRRLGLGLILVSPYDTVSIILEPGPFDREKSRKLNSKKSQILKNELKGRHGNYNTGGSTGEKIMTAYKENALFIAYCLKKYDSLSPKELRKLGTGNKTYSILNMNYYGWFEKKAKGIYYLNNEGKKYLKKYPELIRYFKSKIEKES